MPQNNSSKSSVIVHVFDDDKFLDPALKLFEDTLPGNSKYFVIASKQKPLKHVKSKNITVLDLKESNEKEDFVKYISDNNIQVLFFHALNQPKQLLVNSLSSKIVKVWFIWGYDLYGTWKPLKKNIYDKKTKQFVKKHVERLTFKDELIYNQFSFWLFLKRNYIGFLLPKKIIDILNISYNTEYYKAVKKIDIVVPVVPNEFNVLKKMKIAPSQAPFSYLCLEDVFNNMLNQNVLDAKNILIGNSGDPSNNHVDAFIKISKLNLGDRKIIVPLSYSGTKEYIDFVLERGNFFFGKNFSPMLNFMPLEEYNKIISSCGFVIFNHIRQQAVGNIIALGYSGCKIFLNKRSPVYRYYNEIKAIVFSIESINQKNLDNNLALNEYNINKQVFFDTYSRKSVKSKIKELFEIVNMKLEKKISN